MEQFSIEMIGLMITNNRRLFENVKCISSVSCNSNHRLMMEKARMKKPKLFNCKVTKRLMKKFIRSDLDRKLPKRAELEKKRLWIKAGRFYIILR